MWFECDLVVCSFALSLARCRFLSHISFVAYPLHWRECIALAHPAAAIVFARVCLLGIGECIFCLFPSASLSVFVTMRVGYIYIYIYVCVCVANEGYNAYTCFFLSSLFLFVVWYLC